MRRLIQTSFICMLLSIIGLHFHAYSDECVLLDLETAWKRIIYSAPSIAAADAEVCARHAEMDQVSRTINPLLIIEADNLGVSHPDEEDEPPETTYSISQTVELGGKRGARRALASSLTSVACWEAQIERHNVRFALMTAFILAGVTQQKWKLTQEKLLVEELIVDLIRTQVKNGKSSPIQEKKSQMAMVAAKVCAREAFSEFEQAKKTLSSLWGSVCPDFDGVDFNIYGSLSLPCQSSLLEDCLQSPELLRAKQEIVAASKNLRLQKANSIPDVTFTLGYRVFHDSDQRGWVVGAAMPIPIFDRNRGNIKKASCEVSQTEFHFNALAREMKEKVMIAYEKLAASYEEAEIIRCGALCELQDALELTKTGYHEGKFHYSEYLETQKMYLEVQEKYVEILSKFHLNKAELTRLRGKTLFLE